jgi:hypothetical protein
MELELRKIWFVLPNIRNYQLIKGTLLGNAVMVFACIKELELLKIWFVLPNTTNWAPTKELQSAK